MDPRVVARSRLGEKITVGDYIASFERPRPADSIKRARASGPASSLRHPTCACGAPLDPLLADDDLFFKVNARTLRNTSIGNFLILRRLSSCGTGAAACRSASSFRRLITRTTALLSAASPPRRPSGAMHDVCFDNRRSAIKARSPIRPERIFPLPDARRRSRISDASSEAMESCSTKRAACPKGCDLDHPGDRSGTRRIKCATFPASTGVSFVAELEAALHMRW